MASIGCKSGDWTIFFCWHVKNSFFASLCSYYVCRLCINFQDLCARLLGMATLRILLLTFTSRFVIDFLSIGKVIFFSTKMLQIARRFISAILRNRGGYGKPTAHAHVMMFDALPVGQTPCRVRRQDNGVVRGRS